VTDSLNYSLDPPLSHVSWNPSGWKARLEHFRIIPPLESYPALVDLVQEPVGKVVLLVTFAVPLRLLTNMWPHMVLILALIAFLPQYRRFLVTVGTLTWMFLHNGWIDWGLLAEVAPRTGMPAVISSGFRLASITLFMGFCALCWHLIMHFKNAPFARRPVVFLYGLYATVLLAACCLEPGPMRSWLWCFIILLGGYFWALCYSFTDKNAKTRDGFLLQLGAYHPFWMAGLTTTTPYPKGAAYLRKTEAKPASEFAVTQLKGLKLLLWASILAVILDVFVYLVHGQQTGSISRAVHIPLHFSLPPFNEALEKSVAGTPYPWYICWASVMAAFVRTMLDWSVTGHLIIACCRMAGFRAVRSTYRPLQSRSIADFWNRFSFYFKELLVEFFFFPTYVRYFKHHPRLRMFAATFAAAGLGNLLFHFVRDIAPVAEIGLWKSLVGYQTYVFYAVVLSAGIGISQLRAERKANSQPTTWFRARVISPAAVLLFYCVLHVFDDTGRAHPLSERFVFLAGMFGWRM
jgi:hypothetical protein